MAVADSGLDGLITAVIARDEPAVRELLAASPELALARVATGATRAEASPHFHDEIGHYIYAGDTALHVAAAAHAPLSRLTEARADVGAANRRGAQPLHYAVDGGPNGPHWDPVSQSWQLANWTTGKGGSGSVAAKAQQAEIRRLLEAHDAVTG
jgi:hypothetical protein